MFTNRSILRIFPVLFSLVIMLSLLIGSGAFPTPARADSIITVATSADELNSNGLCSLREAITNANADAQPYGDCVIGSGNDTILFADGITAITLGSTLSTITDADGLTINGGGDVILSGNNSVRVIYVLLGGVLSLKNISVVNGSTNNGAGVLNDGTLDVSDSTFSGNNATGSGGGVWNEGGTATIANSTFSGNTAVADGGGVLNSGVLTLANSTFSNNSGNYGGGLMNNGGIATILNSTFSGNTASVGGGVSLWNGGIVPITTIRNTILANSTAGEDCWAGFGPTTLTGSNNVIEATSTCNAIASLTSDPNLGALTGSPAYFPLLSGSPAINAGNDAICAAAPVSNTSQNGVTRPKGLHCDIGSFEFLFTLFLPLILR